MEGVSEMRLEIVLKVILVIKGCLSPLELSRASFNTAVLLGINKTYHNRPLLRLAFALSSVSL